MGWDGVVYGFSTGMDSRKAHAPPKEAPLQVQVQVQGEQWVEVEVALSRPSKKHVLHTHTSVVLEGVCVRVRVRVCVQGGGRCLRAVGLRPTLPCIDGGVPVIHQVPTARTLLPEASEVSIVRQACPVIPRRTIEPSVILHPFRHRQGYVLCSSSA